jgi:hypothetical protein
MNNPDSKAINYNILAENELIYDTIFVRMIYLCRQSQIASMHFMEAKTRQHYWAPTSQVFTIQPVRILNNSLTDYIHGNLNESVPSSEEPTLESLLGISSFPTFL